MTQCDQKRKCEAMWIPDLFHSFLRGLLNIKKILRDTKKSLHVRWPLSTNQAWRPFGTVSLLTFFQLFPCPPTTGLNITVTVVSNHRFCNTSPWRSFRSTSKNWADKGWCWRRHRPCLTSRSATLSSLLLQEKRDPAANQLQLMLERLLFGFLELVTSY